MRADEEGLGCWDTAQREITQMLCCMTYQVNPADYFSYLGSTFQQFQTHIDIVALLLNNVLRYQNIHWQRQIKYVNLKILMRYERNKNIGHLNKSGPFFSEEEIISFQFKIFLFSIR